MKVPNLGWKKKIQSFIRWLGISQCQRKVNGGIQWTLKLGSTIKSQITRGLQWLDKENKLYSQDKEKTFEVLRVGMVQASGINKQKKEEANCRLLENVRKVRSDNRRVLVWQLVFACHEDHPQMFSYIVFPHFFCQRIKPLPANPVCNLLSSWGLLCLYLLSQRWNYFMFCYSCGCSVVWLLK